MYQVFLIPRTDPYRRARCALAALVIQIPSRLEAHGASNLPGFITPFGSNTDFNCRIRAISRGLRE